MNEGDIIVLILTIQALYIIGISFVLILKGISLFFVLPAATFFPLEVYLVRLWITGR